MTRDIVSNIIDLKRSINQASLQKQQEPIFKSVIENERIAFELSHMSCHSEDEFSKLVDMLFKLIIESSGSGTRFPQDARIEVMISSIKELRNHFFHSREHGKENDVKKKYHKVGEIYFRFTGKNVPSNDTDWNNAKTGLLKLTEDGLERTFEVIIQDTSVETPIFSDNSAEVFDYGKLTSVQSRKRKGLFALSDVPVFIPDFTIHAPLPNVGNKCCVYATTKPAQRASISDFSFFVKEIERKWKSAPFLLSTYGPLNWTLSDDGHFAFGCGAENLAKDLLRHRRVAIGGVMQGCYGEDYGKTCFLVISGYRKGDIVKDIVVDIYLSSIPTDWHVFDDLLLAFTKLQSDNLSFKNYSLMPLTYFCWETKEPVRTNLDIIGGLGREGYGLDVCDRETDTYSGVIVKSKSFSKLKFYCTEGSLDDDATLRHLNPVHLLKDLVISITNTVPYCNEVGSGLITDVFSPRISSILFETPGTTIHAISINCTNPRINVDSETE